jgi:hypothetical protein
MSSQLPDTAQRAVLRRVVTTPLYAVTGAVLGFVAGFGLAVLPFVLWARVSGDPEAGRSPAKADYVVVAAMVLLAARGIVVGKRRRDPEGSTHRPVSRRAAEAVLGVLAALLASLLLWFWSGNVAGALLLVTLPLAVAGALLRPYRGERPAWWPGWWPA